MALTLDGSLSSAQDNKSRRPLIELTSGQRLGDIPFDGAFLTSLTDLETSPVTLTLADGRIAVCYHYFIDGANRGLKFYITNVERNYFDTSFTINTSTDIEGASIEQLGNGDIGIVYLETVLFNTYIRYRIVTTVGAAVSSGTIDTFSYLLNFSHLWVRKTASDFLLVYVHDIIQSLPASGGTYTGTTNSAFTIEVTTSGTYTTGYFRWKKDDGSWNGPILMTGGAQALSDGVTITFVFGNYYDGQQYLITVTAAIKSTGRITVSSVPNDGDQIILGSTTYTYKDELAGGGNPDEVVIDPLSTEITLENLRSAITDTDFEGVGEGVRYGTGTTANAESTATRSGAILFLEALTAGAAGNSITLTVDTDHFAKVAFANGSDAVTSSVSGGDLYGIYERTSSDFTTWGAESLIDLGTLLPSRLKSGPSLTRLANDDIMLFFDYADAVNDNLDSLSNVYFMTSSDDGATWDTPDSITESVIFSELSRHPVAVERDTGALYAMYTRLISSLVMDNSALGWPDGAWDDWAFEVSWDSANRKLYVANMYTSSGLKLIQCVVKVDVDTWSVDKFWDRDTTTPRLSATAGSSRFRSIGDGAITGFFDQDTYVIDILDGEADTITNYYLKDNVAYGYVKNIDWDQYLGARFIRTVQADASSNKLYVLFLDYTGSSSNIQIGYIDTTEAEPYTFNVIVEETATVELGYVQESEMLVVPSINRIFISGLWNQFNGGGLRIYDLDGNVIDDYRYDNDLQFPKWGIRNLCYYDGYIYGSFQYETLYDQGSRRGMVKVNLTTKNCTYHRPSWASVDDYEITSIELGPTGQLIVTCYSYGVTIYNIGSDSWTIYNNSTIPGMIPSGVYSFRCSTYDPVTEYIFSGFHGYFGGQDGGIVMFSIGGQIEQSYYQVGTYPVDAWVWQDEAVLVQGHGDYDAVGTIDAEDTMFVFWESNDRIPIADTAIKWDQDGSGILLDPYLLSDQEVIVRKTIDGSPNTLEFACSDGHLFDPFNALSLLSKTFKKGRKITLRWGETISGVPVWQNGGEFYVTEAKTSYKRGVYSKLSVKCEDDRTFWTDKKLLVSEDYDDTPQAILTNLLTDYADIDVSDIDLPVMSTGNLDHQFVDVTLEDAINQICSRFGYFFTINVDGEYTARKIDDGNDIDHTYFNSDKLLEFTPDNTYSNNINKIRVIGNELTVNELSTEEEIVGTLNGTVGWWGGKKEHTVWYSEDQERRAQNIRLHVVETTTSIGFALSGDISEYLDYEDPLGKYCIVVIDSPNLTPILIAALVALIASFFVPDGVYIIVTIRIGSYLSAFACWLAVNVLGAIGTYDYEIYGFPFGDVSYSIEATSDDTVNQTDVGYIIEQQVNDDLCYSTIDCQQVADFEMMVISLQRNSLAIQKITHLQDEEGDTLVFPHPYSGLNMRMFATELTRKFKKATNDGEEGDGYFYDSVDGWVIT